MNAHNRQVAAGRSWRLPLTIRIALTATLLIVISLATMSAIVLQQQTRLMSEQINDFGRAITDQLAAGATELVFTDDQFELQILVTNFAKSSRIPAVVVYTAEGDLMAGSGEARIMSKEDLLAFAASAESTDTPLSLLDHGYEEVSKVFISPITFQGVTGGYATVTISHNPISRSFTRSLRSIIALTLITCVLVAIVAYYLSRRLSRPIHTLIDAAQGIEDGSFQRITERRNDEIGELIDAINNMGQGLLEKSHVEALLRRFIAPDVADQIMGKLESVRVGGERVHATVLFADIVDFTGMSESMSPEAVAEFLNEYFGYFTACGRLYFGVVDKFIGDAVMMVFGTPREDEEHAFHAMSCAVLMQKLMSRLNHDRIEEGKSAVELRIGINSGEMLAGVMGSKDRMEYTVVGDSVNIASRLCSEARAGQIIVQESLQRAVSTDHHIEVEDHKMIRVRGKKEPVGILAIKDIEQKHQITMDNFISDIVENRVTELSE